MPTRVEFELSLDGSLQPIKGALPIAIKAREEGYKGFILPNQNAKEAAIVNELEVYGIDNIKQVIPFLKTGAVLPGAFLLTYIFTKLVSHFTREQVFYTLLIGFLIYFAAFLFIFYPNLSIFHTFF